MFKGMEQRKISSGLVGVDIGRSHISAVRLVRTGEQVQTVGLGEVGVPRGAIEDDGTIRRPDQIAAALKLLWKTHQIKAKKVLVHLPCHQMVIQPTTRPADFSPQELDTSVRFELAPTLSYPASEMTLGFDVVGEDDQLVHLLTFASHNAVGTHLAKIVSDAGLKHADTQPEPVALVQAIRTEEDPNIREALLNIGARSSTVMLLRGGQVIYAQSIPLGGEHFTEALAEATGMEPAAAEQFKRRHSLIAPDADDPYPVEREALRRCAENYVDAIYQVFSYDAGDVEVKRMLLCGGGAQLAGLNAYFNQLLGLPVARVSPADGLVVADEERFASHALAYGIALLGKQS